MSEVTPTTRSAAREAARTASVPPGRAPKKPRPRPRISIVGIFGELLVTLGVVTMLFAVWQMWIAPEQRSVVSNAEGAALSAQWDADYLSVGSGQGEPAPEPTASATDIPRPTAPEGTEIFASMIVPRFGENNSVVIAGGVTRAETLDLGRIGWYPTSRMPGDVGNFAVAGHRTSLRSTPAFFDIDKLRLGDAIVVETPEGWYTYRFRSMEYVAASQIDVLADVPQFPGVTAEEKYITLTGCTPLWTADERIIAYGTFDNFQPRADGPPQSVTEGVQ